MTDDKKKYPIATGGGLFGYLTIQSAMLALHYAFNKPMPWYITWFPTIVALTMLGIVGVIMLIVVIMAATT